MSQQVMYPAKDGSPQTTTLAELSESATSVSITEMACYPTIGTENGNIIVFYDDNGNWERCIYSVKSVASGNGSLTIARSGSGWASSSGSPIAWPAGTKCGRNYTGYDYEASRKNILDHETRIGANSTAIAQNSTAIESNSSAITQNGSAIATVSSNLSSHTANKSNPHSVTASQIGAASGTTQDKTIYVYKDATGTGTGEDKSNAFTSINEALNSLPAIINDNITILVCSGSVPYRETVMFQRDVAGGSVTIQGEHFWNNQCGVNSTLNRLVKASTDDFSDVEVGDTVCLITYSGTYQASYPSACFYGTVTDISGAASGYVTVSMKNIAGDATAGVTPTTGWQYIITRTDISASDDSGTTKTRDNIVVNKGITSVLTIKGVKLTYSRSWALMGVADVCGPLVVDSCIFSGCNGLMYTISSQITAKNIVADLTPESTYTVSRPVYAKNAAITFTGGGWIDCNGVAVTAALMAQYGAGVITIGNTLGLSNGASSAVGTAILANSKGSIEAGPIYISNKFAVGVACSYGGLFAGFYNTNSINATTVRSPASNPADWTRMD